MQLINEIKAYTTNWKILIAQFINNNIDKDDSDFDKVYDIFTELRNVYKKEQKIPEEICKEIDDEELVIAITDYLNESLRWYFDLKLFRLLQDKNFDKTNQLIEIIFDKYVLNAGVNIIKLISDLLNSDEYSEEMILNALNALDFFAYYSVENPSDIENISISLQQNGGLCEKISNQIAKLIFKNRIELKLNVILKKLNDRNE